MLPRQERLSLAREIKRIAGAKEYSGKSPLLYLVAGGNSLGVSRIAVVVPKSLGNAVIRNRLRRRLVAVFAAIKAKIVVPVDIVVYPRMAAISHSQDMILGDFMQTLKDWRVV